MVLDTGLEASVLWPFGYSAGFDPFVVYDNSGKAVGRDGVWLHAGGTGPFDGPADACGRARWVMVLDLGKP
jgi:hypothetical protein